MAKSGLKAALAEETTKRCSFARVIEPLTSSDRALLDDYLDNPMASSTGIQRALRRIGVNVATQRISEHRSRVCICETAQ